MATKFNRRELRGVTGNMQGEVSERVMYDWFLQHNKTLRAWDNGVAVFEQEGVVNVYERLPDGSWSIKRSRAAK